MKTFVILAAGTTTLIAVRKPVLRTFIRFVYFQFIPGCREAVMAEEMDRK